MIERRVERWMSHDVIALRPKATIRDALDLMERERIRHVLIVDEKERLAGIVSDRDVKRVVAQRGTRSLEKALDRPLQTIMTRRVLRLDPGATLIEAAELMCREKISALPVVDDESVLGIITSEDILWAFVELDREDEEEREDEEIERTAPDDREVA
ncbi:MAG TPA: CBS domain-containing protein [Planctomycetota bacterium]|nr:CBS domain-containing protein [Planctomycetota bacterium]